MSPQPFPYQRVHHRIAFPARQRPRLILSDGRRFTVVDCSQGGLRFLLGKADAPREGAILEGSVRFRGGRTVEVSAVVVRVQDGEVAVRLEEGGIPFSSMWAEQRRLRRHILQIVR